MSKKLSKICQICTFLSHYVYTYVYTWKTLFFCLNFGPFWTFLSHCVQGVYGHFFHKNFYHFFIFYFFTKFYFSLISRWKFEKTSICTTIWYHIYFKIYVKNFVKNLSNLHIFVTLCVHICLHLKNILFLSKFWSILDNFVTLCTECISIIFY